MRELLRLTALFLVAVMAMAMAYGFGFATALRMPGLLGEVRAVTGIGTTGADATGTGDSQPLALTDQPTAASMASAGEGADDFGLFWEAYEHIESEYYGPLPADAEITYGALRGSMRSLDDPYTMFTDPIVTEIERPDLAGEFEGIGAYVTQNEEGQLVIQTPMRGQPAERAGIMAGDIVLKVDGVDIGDMSTEDAVLLIRGPKGTTVTLTIYREGELLPQDIPVVRDKIDIPSVNDAHLLQDEGAPEVGYLQLTVFAAETRLELETEIDRLRVDGARALILDLRNNPGGFLNTAVEVTSQFISSGVVAYQEDRNGNRISEVALPDGHALDMPLVVLVNGGSASASEIVAGALRDHGRARVVGSKTFGKGSVQNVHTLSDESQIRVTVAVWLTPAGELIHKRGITPDVVVDITAEDIAAKLDPQFDRAVEEALKLLESS